MESKSSEAKVGNDEEFLDGLMPSEETQAKKFLSHANGVGVVVAVFGTYSHHKIMRIYSYHDTLHDAKRYTHTHTIKQIRAAIRLLLIFVCVPGRFAKDYRYRRRDGMLRRIDGQGRGSSGEGGWEGLD